jgi:hypothetical protein
MKKILLIICIFVNYLSYSQDTYVQGSTEYYNNQYYSTTGKPVVKRSETNKKIFLKSQGYTETPSSYQIDHIIPLSEGGTDDPSNMQLLTIRQHKEKTARERTNRSHSNSTYSSPNSYYNNSTYINSYEESITIANYSRTENGKIIYKGTSGGEYYLGDSGNKVYVKNSTPKSTSSNYYSNSSSSSSPTSSSYSNSTYSTPSSSTSTSRDIQTGPRGGQYYINSNGNKTYIKK